MGSSDRKVAMRQKLTVTMIYLKAIQISDDREAGRIKLTMIRIKLELLEIEWRNAIPKIFS